MYGIIYGLYDPRTEALRYIGQTTRTSTQRLRAHLTPSALRRHSYVARWLSGLSRSRLIPTCSILAEAQDQEELDRLEVEWIAKARSEGASLVNLADGGGGRPGYVVPPEVRERIAAKQRGVPKPKHTEEWKAQMSAQMTGRNTNTAEHLEALAALKRGVSRSAETRAKISAAKKGRGLTPDHREKVVAALRAVDQTTISRRAGSSHPAFRHDITTEYIVGQLKSGRTKVEVARELGVSPTFIHRRIREHRKDLSLAKQGQR